jgi:hypothetical protein
MLAQYGRNLLGRQRAPVERAEVGQLAGCPDEATAEVVLAARVELDVRRKHSAVLVEESHQTAVMIEMAMADNQSVDLPRVDAHEAHVVEEHVGGVAEIEQQGAGLVAALGFKPQRQAPLGVNDVWKAGLHRGRLHAYAVDCPRAQEKILR